MAVSGLPLVRQSALAGDDVDDYGGTDERGDGVKGDDATLAWEETDEIADKGHNGTIEDGAHSIGVCYEGGLDERGRAADTRTPAQKKALLTLLCSLKQDYPDAEIVGHCELEGVHKACPSFPVSTLRAQIKQLGY